MESVLVLSYVRWDKMEMVIVFVGKGWVAFCWEFSREFYYTPPCLRILFMFFFVHFVFWEESCIRDESDVQVQWIRSSLFYLGRCGKGLPRVALGMYALETHVCTLRVCNDYDLNLGVGGVFCSRHEKYV